MKKALVLVFMIIIANAIEIKPLHKINYNKQKALLGKKIFFDTSFSKDKKIACVSCHNIHYNGADNKRFSIGVYSQLDTPMNAPTVFNAVFNIRQFWNGRAKDLKEQAIDALLDKKEHGLTKKEIEKIANKKYLNEFRKIYKTNYVTAMMVADVIAEYEKSLVTVDSKFDLYLKGKSKLTQKEKNGYFKFKMYGCITCHNGINVGGNSFQKVGIFTEFLKIPRGIDRYYVTHLEDDKYVYKVPTLRNIELTAPYFHDGSVKTLPQAVLLMGRLNLGIDIPKDDIEDIVAFLKTLTGKRP